MKKLEELEAKLIKAREELEKMFGGDGNGSMNANASDVNTAVGKKENENLAIKTEMIKYDNNGQWRIEKADIKSHGPAAQIDAQGGVPKKEGHMQSMHGEVKNIDPKTNKEIKKADDDIDGYNPKSKEGRKAIKANFKTKEKWNINGAADKTTGGPVKEYSKKEIAAENKKRGTSN